MRAQKKKPSACKTSLHLSPLHPLHLYTRDFTTVNENIASIGQCHPYRNIDKQSAKYKLSILLTRNNNEGEKHNIIQRVYKKSRPKLCNSIYESAVGLNNWYYASVRQLRVRVVKS